MIIRWRGILASLRPDQLLLRLSICLPNDAQGYFRLGLVIRRKDSEAALQAFNRALQLDPFLIDARYEQGALLREIGRLPEALAKLEACAAAEPENVDVLSQLGGILLNLKRAAQAEVVPRKAALIDPDNRGCSCTSARTRTRRRRLCTYIYIWNVPMPMDEADTALYWKRQASTVGTQLIATGHSLTDEYMAFDVGSYARLSRYAGGPHYIRVPRLLLLGTKSMIATPDRPYDLKGPGWQQEHWSFAPRVALACTGCGFPWVATSQLKGIVGLRQFDPELLKELAGKR